MDIRPTGRGFVELVMQDGAPPLAVVARNKTPRGDKLAEHAILFFGEGPPYALWANAYSQFPKAIKSQGLQLCEIEGCYYVPFLGDNKAPKKVLTTLLAEGFEASMQEFSCSPVDMLMQQHR